ncbi:MAG: (d)CMP kinase [Clostridiales bacterium]|jgi:cytidylate kinase|nr:(d)CMP kinase [Clostridiales bacterium]
MKRTIYQIAIDGPSGAGKSTVADRLAARFRILHLDTGAMYRAVGLKCLRTGVSPTDAAAVEGLLATTVVDVRYEGGRQRTLLDGEDVSVAIRDNPVSKAASDASAIQAVRTMLVAAQQAIAQRICCVLDGRDIGTKVLPEARYKFFLTASAEERARRRTLELAEKGAPADYGEILRQIQTRDYNDTHRAASPLVCADGAHTVDSTSMSLDEVVATIAAYITDR